MDRHADSIGCTAESISIYNADREFNLLPSTTEVPNPRLTDGEKNVNKRPSYVTIR